MRTPLKNTPSHVRSLSLSMGACKLTNPFNKLRERVDTIAEQSLPSLNKHSLIKLN